VEEAVGEETDGRHGVDDGEHVVELEGALPRPVVRLVHVPQGGVPQRPVRPPRPELHPDLHARAHSEISPNFANAQVYLEPTKERPRTAAPTESANVPNISLTGTSPPCSARRRKIPALWRKIPSN